MVRTQVAARGVKDARVLQALRVIAREDFVPDALVDSAYDDNPLPIEEAQTISQPYVVALTLEALELEPGDNVLDVGTGSGYAAAVAAKMVREVWGIERHQSLADAAALRFLRLGFANIHVTHGDGSRGWPAHAPFDAIMVGAACPTVPASLKQQLRIGGRLILPVGADSRVQELVRIRRTGAGTWTSEDLGAVRFVPLIGGEGFREPEPT